MKKSINLLLVLFVAFAVISCNCGEGEEQTNETETVHDGHHEGAVKPTASTGNFGDEINADNAIAASELPVLLEEKELVEAKLIGNVASVCQMTGCWMDVEIGDGEIVHITFKDDGFLMPKDAEGKTAIFEGEGTYEEISVDLQKHLAEDAGKSQEEIDAITEPALEYTFVAKGVILQ